jgi:hypothetical protein
MVHRCPARDRVVAGLVSLALLSLALGCHRSAEEGRDGVVVFGLDDQASGVIDKLEFNVESTRKMLTRALEESKKLVLVEEERDGDYRAEMTITLASERESTRPDEKGVYRAVQVDLSLFRWRGDHEREQLSAQGKAFMVQDPDNIDKQEGFNQVLQMAISQAVRLIDLQLDVRTIPAARLGRLLSSDNPEERLYVLRTLRERHEPQLVPRVIQMLSDPDSEIAMEAVGVLVALKDQRSVLPLIRMAHGHDLVFLLQIITALGEIKGPVARGYLFTLAAGHSSPEIRERAREALEHIMRAQAASGPGRGDEAIAYPQRDADGSDSDRRGAK